MSKEKENFVMDEVLEALEELEGKGLKKILRELFTDKDYMSWLFAPNNDDRAKIKQQQEKLYGLLTRPKTIKVIASSVDEPTEADRSLAVHLTAIANLAKTLLAENTNNINKRVKSGDISEKKAKEKKQDLAVLERRIEDIEDVVKDIIKKRAKKLSNKSGVPKKICNIAYKTVPSSKYIDKYKIGLYLSTLLNTLYTHIEDKRDTYDSYFEDKSAIKGWTIFFEDLFGEKNLCEVATFILLEGLHRLKPFKSSAVRECWDSLTKWSLKTLNDAPESVVTQMVELYIKRLSRMFQNGTYELRINLLTIDKHEYKSLYSVIEKYEDKIKEIIER